MKTLPCQSRKVTPYPNVSRRPAAALDLANPKRRASGESTSIPCAIGSTAVEPPEASPGLPSTTSCLEPKPKELTPLGELLEHAKRIRNWALTAAVTGAAVRDRRDEVIAFITPLEVCDQLREATHVIQVLESAAYAELTF